MPPHYKGLLLTQDFLTLGIVAQPVWDELSAADVTDFAEKCDSWLLATVAARNINEAQTRTKLIAPIIDHLGWQNAHLSEISTGVGDFPDYLLYKDTETCCKAEQLQNPADSALVLLEAKKWQLPLDRRSPTVGTPSSQILRYLRNAENTDLEWGILTNGAQWRLYYRRAQSRSEHFLELDIEEILKLPADEKNHWLRVFMLMFCRDSFLPLYSEHRTFHQIARDEGKNWEQAITDALSRQIMEEIFPNLARAIAKNVPELQKIIKHGEYESAEAIILLNEVRDNTVILLFRMLFILYAEDRHLLPITETTYKNYSLRNLRDTIEDLLKNNDNFSPTMSNYYNTFNNLCKAIAQGDSSLSVPPYNGGLFDKSYAKLLPHIEIINKEFGGIIDSFSRKADKRIHYHDLSVQHLGAMYEQLLEHDLYITPAGEIAARLSRFSRKTGGSYYTPDDLVRLVIERTVGGLLNQRQADFIAAQKAGLTGKPLKAKDSAAQALQIKVCDPAMGSGHFLVSLVDYLADWILAEIAATEHIKNYQSPLVKEIADIRQHIKDNAKKGGWNIKEEQLEDRQIIRRIVLKKCVYGADKNFMAVELSKLSLWLHTFTVGAPLTFLDHHLRCGDSLFGEWSITAREQLFDLHCGLDCMDHMQKAESAAEEMSKIEQLPDSDIEQVRSSKEKHAEMCEKVKILDRAISFLHALRWLNAPDKDLPPDKRKEKYRVRKNTIRKILMNVFDRENGLTAADKALRTEAENLIKRESFIHWELAFPGVWTDMGSPKERRGGFDAIIGNPPWNRMNMEDIGWFSARLPEISRSPTQDARKKKIAALIKSKNPIAREYKKAAEHATAAVTVARDCGYYPIMGRGYINLYFLFIERALSLAKPNAFIGLLVPSGIYGDKTTSKFFSNIATSKRLHSLLDFINSPIPFFADVHRSFKFCVFIFGGTAQKFAKAECAYHLNDTKDLNSKLIEFKNGDFAYFNPNTGNAPIFRNQRDVKIALNIYRRLPILHKDGDESIWPAKYMNIIQMSADSSLFMSGDKLANDGFYPTADNHYKNRTETYLPLYEGKMVQMFDHRAADIIVNSDNINRPAQTQSTTVEQKQKIDHFPNPRFWIPLNILQEKFSRGFGEEEMKHFDFLPKAVVAIKDISASINMRSMIAAILPVCGYGDTLNVLVPSISKRSEHQPIEIWKDNALKEKRAYEEFLPFMTANMNAFIFDFLCRQKMPGLHISAYILKQLPIIPPSDYQKKIGGKTAADIIRAHVLRLTYNSNDMTDFAREMKYKGKPFVWDNEKRRHLQARLDALYFILYGIERKDAEYIMDSFPIVRYRDEDEHGGYLTRDLILNYMNALNSGNISDLPIPRY